MTSILRRIRHQNDIPLLVNEYIGERYGSEGKNDRVTAARLARKWIRYEEQDARLPPDLRRYTLSRQHDAEIEDVVRAGDRLTIRVRDEDVAILAEIVTGVNHREWRFPFEVVLEGVSYAEWRAIDAEGELTWMPAPKPGTLTWISDSFVEIESPGVRWALEVYQAQDRTYEYRMLLVEAARMSVIERQRATWQGKVGDQGLPLLDDFLKRRAETPTLLLQSDVRRVLRDHGFHLPEDAE